MKHIYRILTACCFLFLACACICVCSARVKKDSLSVYFRQDSHVFDPNLNGNGARCDEFVEKLLDVQSNSFLAISGVEFVASASPEGNVFYNEMLVQRRANSIAEYLREKITFADSIIVVRNITEDWKSLENMILADPKVPARAQVLDIISKYEGDEAEEQLMSLNEGKSWKYIYRKFFPLLRSFTVHICIGSEMVNIEKVVFAELPTLQAPVPNLTYTPKPVTAPAVPKWTRQLTLKTNTLGWALLGENIAVEVDLCPQLSIAVPFYYSGGLDYFKETLKFRGIVLQPEVRWYPSANKHLKNDGFYVGAHFGLGWYNFALNGDWRIQDHKGNTPAYGGGIGLGYALKFKKNPRWGMEFGIGGGVYNVVYDRFYNEANGPYDEQAVSDIWFGVDNAAISFTYDFDLIKKGGKK